MSQTTYRQRGAVLLVSLIILILMTLLAITAYNMGKTSLQVVGNMQQRNQALVAAQTAINDVVSSTRFVYTPSAPLSNGSDTMVVDEVRVTVLKPVCLKAQILKSSQLNLAKEEDRGCTLGAEQNFGVQGAATDMSLCAEGLWEINAEAKDPVSEAAYIVTQGVGVRFPTNEIAAVCPP